MSIIHVSSASCFDPGEFSKPENALTIGIFKLSKSFPQRAKSKIIYIDQTLFQEAITLFRHYETPVLSLTDCASFIVCQRYEIHEAFGFDRHFPMMGISLTV